MSRFQELKQELEECACIDCNGSGTHNDADAGDITYNEWTCTTCNGSGINPEMAISLDIDRTI